MDKKQILGKNIRNYRQLRGMTQAQLAEELGCAASTIAMYETGKREPDFDQLEALADVFNVRMRDLVPDQVISTDPWDPNDMDWADKEDEATRIMARGMAKMSPENRRKLVEVAKLMFAEDFDEEGNKRK